MQNQDQSGAITAAQHRIGAVLTSYIQTVMASDYNYTWALLELKTSLSE
jgi:hypothetical protein